MNYAEVRTALTTTEKGRALSAVRDLETDRPRCRKYSWTVKYRSFEGLRLGTFEKSIGRFERAFLAILRNYSCHTVSMCVLYANTVTSGALKDLGSRGRV